MDALVHAEKLCLRFGAIVAADNIDFSLKAGERLAVIGANGAGKTTFINICTGFLKPNSGRIFFDGREVTHLQPRDIARLGLGRSFQLPQLFWEHSTRECLELAGLGRLNRRPFLRPPAQVVERHEVADMLELIGLTNVANEPVSRLPEGYRKLLDVAMALMLHPKLLILDEPTSGVASEDKHGIMETLMQALTERKVTSWFVEHDTDIVMRYASRVAAWIDGRIAADGTPSAVFANPQIRKEVLGGDMPC